MSQKILSLEDFTPEDIASLPREQQLRLYDIIQEYKRRLRDQRDIYSPNDGQRPVHQSEAKERWVFAGNGGGKSAMAANEAIWALSGYNPVRKVFTKVPCRVIVVLDHPEKVTDQWVPELQKWANLKPEQLKQRGRAYVSQIQHDSGSEILFMFHQQDPMIFESIEADVIIFDEPPPRHIYIALKRGLRKKGRKPWILGVGTPIQAAWLRTEIYDPWTRGQKKNVECFRYGTALNKENLADGYMEDFAASLTEKERRIRLEGEFFDLEGLALAHVFNRQTHIVEGFEWPEANPCVVAIDPHPAKAHHAILLGIDKYGYMYYLKEIRAKLVPREFARVLKEWYQGYRVIDIVSDSLGSQEYTGGEGFSSFIQVLNDEGVRARPTTWEEKDDESFIARIQNILTVPREPNNFGQRVPKLRIFQGCHGIVSDVENVQFVKFKNVDEYKPKLDISNKDYLSCLKYALATNLTFGKDLAYAYAPSRTPTTYGGRPSHMPPGTRETGVHYTPLSSRPKKSGGVMQFKLRKR
jgi:hypothetical protein